MIMLSLMMWRCGGRGDHDVGNDVVQGDDVEDDEVDDEVDDDDDDDDDDDGVTREKDDDVENYDAEEEDNQSQDRAARFVPACSAQITSTCNSHFMREFTGTTPRPGLSPEHRHTNTQTNTHTHTHLLRSSLRSRHASQHLARATLHGTLRGKMLCPRLSPEREHTLCASLQLHGHVQEKGRNPD